MGRRSLWNKGKWEEGCCGIKENEGKAAVR